MSSPESNAAKLIRQPNGLGFKDYSQDTLMELEPMVEQGEQLEELPEIHAAKSIAEDQDNQMT